MPPPPKPPLPLCLQCREPGKPAQRHNPADCPKAPAQPTREQVAQRLKDERDDEAAQKKRDFWLAAHGGKPPKEEAEPKRGAKAAEDADGGWDGVREEAQRLFPSEPDPHVRMLLWLNHRRTLAGMHPMNRLWMAAARDFWASGKPVMVARKGLRAGGSVHACCFMLIDALDTQRQVDPGTVLVFPIMSSSRDEATDRFFTIRRMMRACGIAPVKGDDEEMGEVIAGGIGGEYKSTKSLSGGGVIQFEDSQGHKCEMRILPAMRRAAVGYTGGGGFLDETDLWPADAELHVNPADVVITDVLKRVTTQPTARIYIFSASYYAASAHSRRVDMGDTSAQFVMRLGEEGARIDEAARRALAAKINSDDPRLLAPGDPTSPDLPAWVYNETAPIERCYQMSDDKLSVMLGLYGGRATENAPPGALPPFAKVEVQVDERDAAPLDVVVGVAPPGENADEWGIVAVAATLDGFRVLADASGPTTGSVAAAAIRHLTAEHRASVLATADERRVSSEIAAALAGTLTPAPPIASVDIFDGADFRPWPLRTLYERGRLRHGAGLEKLADVFRAWTPDARSPRLEALAAAVARLVACYPWLGAAQGSAEPMRGPRARDGMHERRRDARDVVR